MSQGSTTLGRFQLAKFSYAINSKNSKGPFTWSHVYGNNELIGRFERYASPLSGKILFKIIRNDAILEEVNLTEIARALESQSQSNAAASTISLVVRRPCLAIKFPLSDDRSYRFQIMFSSDGDYCSVLAILNEINCQFTEMRTTSGHQSNRLGLSHLSTRNDLSSSSENFTPSVSMTRPYTSNPAISSISNRSLPSSSSSSVTLAGSNRTFSTYGNNAPLTAATTIPEVAMPPLNNWSKELPTRPFTAIVQRNDEDLDLPPIRHLPFSKPAQKRIRKESEPADATPSKIPRTEPGSTPRTTKSQVNRARPGITPSASAINYIEDHTNHATTTSVGTQTDFEPSSVSDTRSTVAGLTKSLSYTGKDELAKLEETICNLINDDEFMQLCIALQGTWRRVAVGK
ncbi:hypothetical protein BJY01DRAFT_242023 [Aspergillus pseudoustus]|uniref:Uncharacterized protein n=1 Tax=Aspergillus pseudoustus TaxID=1810923 RepID=A0ABR4L095_9EURO